MDSRLRGNDATVALHGARQFLDLCNRMAPSALTLRTAPGQAQMRVDTHSIQSDLRLRQAISHVGHRYDMLCNGGDDFQVALDDAPVARQLTVDVDLARSGKTRGDEVRRWGL